MKQPKVSVVIPVYRVEQYIGACVQSVIDQDYACIELLLVDDCGGDRSIELAEQTLAASEREGLEWRVLRHERNRGVSVARNTAFDAATGDYIFCLDSDDRLMPQCISRLVERAEQTQADVTMCDHVSDDGRQGIGGRTHAPVPLVTTNAECIRAFSELWFSLGPWCKLVRANFLRRHHLYFREGIINEDAPWLFQVSIAAQRMAFINEPFYFYRYSPTSIMSLAKVEDMNKSAYVTIDLTFRTFLERKDLWGNLDAYRIWMRQLVLLYTRTANHLPFKRFRAECRKLSSWRIPFKRNAVTSNYYKLWELGIRLPNALRAIYLYALIKLQRSVGKAH